MTEEAYLEEVLEQARRMLSRAKEGYAVDVLLMAGRINRTTGQPLPPRALLSERSQHGQRWYVS